MSWPECGDGVQSRDGNVAGTFIRTKWDDRGVLFGLVERDDTGTVQAVILSDLLPLEEKSGGEVSTTIPTDSGPAVVFLR